ncbi:hypothetical protein E0H39_29720 [Rhizobium leguminosarum bv. viciae]|uniref:hypothetical protein n=1 Tax=Rhizobium leguminosarum TaxID=384 RepID=UPI00103CF5AA|nr:hypothetical protein [Rhizobium leguminosarum]TBY57686.1 hypothetical protein E0H39_29720 [Rhizobium leguminosarum bv. viciae]
MSNGVKQETGDVLGDDRDFFEEDFAPLVPGSFVELPEGYDVSVADLPDDAGHLFPAFLTRDSNGSITSLEVGRRAGSDREVIWSVRMDEDELGKPVTRDIQIEGVDGAFDYVGYVSRKQLDDDQTKATIADLLKHGLVTIVDGKTGTSIDAAAYKAAARQLEDGARYPYDDPVYVAPATDWAHSAVRGILYELLLRRAVAHPLDIDKAVREKVVEAMSDIVRAAFIRRA